MQVSGKAQDVPGISSAPTAEAAGNERRTPASDRRQNLFLPIACFACLAWVGIFVVIYLRLPRHNVGITALLLFAGALLVFPWMGLVMGILRRLQADDSASGNHDSKP